MLARRAPVPPGAPPCFPQATPSPLLSTYPQERSSPPALGNPPLRDPLPFPGVLATRQWEGHLDPAWHPPPHFRGFSWGFLLTSLMCPELQCPGEGGPRPGHPPNRPFVCSHVHPPTPPRANSHLSGHTHASRTHWGASWEPGALAELPGPPRAVVHKAPGPKSGDGVRAFRSRHTPTLSPCRVKAGLLLAPWLPAVGAGSVRGTHSHCLPQKCPQPAQPPEL